MATVRKGNQSVLIVVDVQVDVVKQAWEAPRVIGNVARAVERARERRVPVIWVQHEDEQYVPDTPGWQWVPELVPASNETQIHKRFNSSFEATALEAELQSLCASHIVLAGAASNWCIRATAYAALERGYDLTLIEDGHTTKSMTLEDGTQLAAADIDHELNIAMTWLSYPGRTNRTAQAETTDFAARSAAAVG